MGKPDGFLVTERQENPWKGPETRIADFQESRLPLEEKARRLQASRCMNCGVPFCQSAIELKGKVTGCPLHNLIPEWNDEIYNRHDRHALSRLLKTNPFPEFTGRVCPALCEKACLNGIDGQPVTIHDNELYIIETAWKNGWMEPEPPAIRSGKKAAVVGSGPTGLAAAHYLNRRGHSVTVFERDDRPGGLLLYGIPNMKLDKGVIARRISHMEAEGIDFVCDCQLGTDITLEELEDRYDTVVLACGAREPRRLNCPGEDLEGVHFAVDWLKETTKAVMDGRFPQMAKGLDVVIVGGGDTGNDCIATAIRQGANSVTAIEMMPKAPDQRKETNPWPEWPNVSKTDYGHEEAIKKFGYDPRQYERTVIEVLGEDGKTKAVKTAQVSFDGGMHIVEGTEEILPCDLLLVAAGFTGVEDGLLASLDLETTPRHVLKTDAGHQTSVPGIFAAGDVRRGPSLVVWAIAEGKEAARAADRYLMGYTNMEG